MPKLSYPKLQEKLQTSTEEFIVRSPRNSLEREEFPKLFAKMLESCGWTVEAWWNRSKKESKSI